MDPIENEASDSGASKQAYSGTLDEMSDRDAMLKAAEAAIKADESGEGEDSDDVSRETKAEAKAPEDEKPEEDQEEKPKKEAKSKEAPAEEEKPISKLAREIRARENARKIESDAEGRLQEADGIIQRAKGMWDEVQQARKQLQTDMQELAAFKKDPIAAMHKFGWTPDQFIDASMRAKDPAYQDKVALEEKLSQSQAYTSKLEDRLSRLEERAQSYEEERSTVAQEHATNRFFGSIAEDSPARTLWEPDELIARANKVQAEYQKRTGKVASPEELGEYLHYEARTRLGKVSGTSAELAGSKPKEAGKVKANGSRALSARDTSERHGGGRPVGDMDGDEERAFLIRVAEEAMGRT